MTGLPSGRNSGRRLDGSKWWVTAIRTIFAQPDAAHVREQPGVIAGMLGRAACHRHVDAVGSTQRPAWPRLSGLVWVRMLVAAAERQVQEPDDLAVVYAEAKTLRHALSARTAETSPARVAPTEQATPPPT